MAADTDLHADASIIRDVLRLKMWQQKPFDRRQLMRGSLGTAMGLATVGSPWWCANQARGQGQPSVPFILMVHCGGGWDQTMVFDDQTASSYVTYETGAESAVGAGGLRYVNHPDRPSVRLFFDTYGSNAAIVNGLTTGSMTSDQAFLNCYTSIPSGKVRPVDFLTYYTASLNPVLEIPHAVIKAPYVPGDYSSIAVRLSASSIDGYLNAATGTDPVGDVAEDALATFQKEALRSALKRAATGTRDLEKIKGLLYGQARHNIIEQRLLAVEETLGPIGADSHFLRDGKRAIELFAAGASQCATVSYGGPRAFDTPQDHFARQSALFEQLFADLGAILDHAFLREVAANMILIVTSELGRSPKVNGAGRKGPWAFSSMLTWGKGIAGGKVIDASDATLRGLPINPIFGERSGDKSDVTLEPANVFAAIFLKNNVPMRLIVPNKKPLSAILTTG